MFNNYLKLFIDDEYPYFIDKYLNTITLNRLKYITQFCGCDYTKLYTPLFLYTRFDHSLIVAHMTWHFTHDKKETIAALLHDVGTPCFAHCIDFVLGDYLKQESSEKEIIDMIKQDKELLLYLENDNIMVDDLMDLNNYPILENSTPQLCTDRLDGVLHTCYIWLHTHTLEQIKEIYDNITVFINEYGKKEIGFKSLEIIEQFVDMTFIYGKELQSNINKYVMKYVSEVVKLSIQQNLITLEDLYTKKEQDLVTIFNANFSTWKHFENAMELIRTESKPTNFYISFNTKRRNTIPLIKTINGNKRIINVSERARNVYAKLEQYQDTKFAYIKTIKEI